MVFLNRVAQDVPNFFFHTTAMTHRAPPQAGFDSFFKIAHDELGHYQIWQI
jgi:hypothetical protein